MFTSINRYANATVLIIHSNSNEVVYCNDFIDFRIFHRDAKRNSTLWQYL